MVDEKTRQQLIDAMFRLDERAQHLVALSAALVAEVARFDEEIRNLATVTAMLSHVAPKMRGTDE